MEQRDGMQIIHEMPVGHHCGGFVTLDNGEIHVLCYKPSGDTFDVYSLNLADLVEPTEH